MAEIKTIGIAFDPAPAKAGAEEAKKAATGLATAYEAALRRIDQSSLQVGKSNKTVAEGFRKTETTVTRSTGKMAGDVAKVPAASTKAASQTGRAFTRVSEQAKRMQANSGGAFDRVVRFAVQMQTGVRRNLAQMGQAQEKAGQSATRMAGRYSAASEKIKRSSSEMQKGLSGVQQMAGGVASSMGPGGRMLAGFGRTALGVAGSIKSLVTSLGVLGAAAGLAGGVGLAILTAALVGLGAAAAAALGPLAKLTGGIAAVVIGIKALSVASAQIQSSLALAGPIQQSVLSFQAMTGSMAEAERIMSDLRAGAKRTGGDLAGSLQTVKRFLALGFSPDDAIKLNRSILDVAGAIGMTSEEAKLLGAALAQVQAKGIVSMEELRQQIAEKGVPVFDELSRKLGVTTAALIDMISEGAVGSKSLIDIFLNLEGGFQRFAGGAEKMTKTLPGAIARLKANWEDLKIEMALPLAAAIVPQLNEGSDILGDMTGQARELGEVLADGFGRAMNIIRDGEIAEAMTLAFKAGVEWLWNALSAGWDVVFTHAKVKMIELLAAGTVKVIEFATKLVTGFIDLVARLITGRWGAAAGESMETFKREGDLAAEYMRVSIKNALGQAMEDVVNAFLNGMAQAIGKAGAMLRTLSMGSIGLKIPDLPGAGGPGGQAAPELTDFGKGLVDKLTPVTDAIAGAGDSLADTLRMMGTMSGIPLPVADAISHPLRADVTPDGSTTGGGTSKLPEINIFTPEPMPTRAFGKDPKELKAIDDMTNAAVKFGAAMAGIPVPGTVSPSTEMKNTPANLLDAFLSGVEKRETGAQDEFLEFIKQEKFKMAAPVKLPDVPLPDLPPAAAGEDAAGKEAKKDKDAAAGEDAADKDAKKKGRAKKEKEKRREIPEPIDISAVQRLSIEWGNVDKQLDDLAAGSLMAVRDGMTDALTGIIDGSMSAKEAFTRMAESIIKDITRMIIQMTIQLTLQKALQAAGATQGVVTAVPVAHTGGVVGSGGMTQTSTTGASMGTFHAGGIVGSAGATQTSTSGAMTGGSRSSGGGARIKLGIPTMHSGGVVGAEKSGIRPKLSLDLPSFHRGGMVGRGPEHKEEPQRIKIELPTFHQGGMASSEEIVKVEKGETILTRRRAAELESELESSRDGGKRERPQAENNATIINVFDRNEIADIVATNPDAVLNAMSRRLPAVRKLVMGGNRL